MIFYHTNEFRYGLKIVQDREPCMIIASEFVKPGKGQAFHRVRLRNLISGKVIEKTFKSGAAVEAADVVNMSLLYLYKNGDFWHFMDKDSFEQWTADAKVVGDNAKWLIDQVECVLTLWNNKPISVTPPNFVLMNVITTTPGVKADTVSSPSWKLATLSSGVVIKVPVFIQNGQVIKVDTRSGEYIAKVK